MTSAAMRYTFFRLVIFVGCLGALAALGARGLLLAALAVVLSMALSYILLRGQRDALAAVLADRHQRRLETAADRAPTGLAADQAAEDAEDDARRAREQAGAPAAAEVVQPDSASPNPSARP